MIVAVINKIVRDLDELIKWNGEVVAPANTLRLKCCDCKSPDCIYCNYVVMWPQADQE